MAHQELKSSDIHMPMIIEIPVAPTPVVDTVGRQTLFVANRLFICTGTVFLDFRAPGYTPDTAKLVFPIQDNRGNQLIFSDPGDILIRSTVHVSLNEIHNDDGEQFSFGVEKAGVANDMGYFKHGRDQGKMFVAVELIVAGGDKNHDGHINVIGYHVTLLAQIMSRPLIVELD